LNVEDEEWNVEDEELNVEDEVEGCLEVGNKNVEMAEVDKMDGSTDDQVSFEQLPCMMRSEVRERFVIETKTDLTLQICRDLAEKQKGGYH